MNPEFGFIETVDVALAGRGMQEVSFPINLDKSPNAINVSSISGQKIATRIHLQLRQLMRAACKSDQRAAPCTKRLDMIFTKGEVLFFFISFT